MSPALLALTERQTVAQNKRVASASVAGLCRPCDMWIRFEKGDERR